ncbi:MAG: hypothetical protein IJG05_10050 [Solobacterium sp.]|nr:hypothetical protein [Solobacterium sp.]
MNDKKRTPVEEEEETLFFGLYKKKKESYSWDLSTDIVIIIVCLCFAARMIYDSVRFFRTYGLNPLNIVMASAFFVFGLLGIRAAYSRLLHAVRLTRRHREEKKQQV